MTSSIEPKLKYISKTIVNCMKIIRADEDLMKLLLSKSNKPYIDKTITTEYVKKRLNPSDEKGYNDVLAPFPFNETAKIEDETNIRIYSSANYFIENSAWLQSTIVFDVITPKSQWLIYGKEKESLIRPYEIVARIVNVFDELKQAEKSIEGIYKLKFDGFSHISVGTSFEGVRIYAKVDTVEARGTTI